MFGAERRVVHMDYKSKIFELLNKIDDEKVLKLVYEILLRIG